MKLISFWGLAPARIKVNLWSRVWGFGFSRMPLVMTEMSGLVWIAMCGPIMVMHMKSVDHDGRRSGS